MIVDDCTIAIDCPKDSCVDCESSNDEEACDACDSAYSGPDEDFAWQEMEVILESARKAPAMPVFNSIDRTWSIGAKAYSIETGELHHG